MTRLAFAILIGIASLLSTLKLHAQTDYSTTRLIVKLIADVPVTMQGNAVTFPDAPNKQNQRGGQKGNIQRLLRSTPTNARGRNVNKEPLLLTFNETIDIPAKMKELMATGLYEYVEPDYVSTIATNVVPNDPLYYRFQWGPNNDGSETYPEGFPNRPGAQAGADSNMEAAWGIAQGSSSITVAVIDTGIKLDHPEFTGRWWSGPGGEKGYDFFNEDSDPTDDNGHGTHVAGILGATGNNANLMAGVDWNCKLMALKTSGSDGNGFESQWVAAIYYAVDNGADVINLSLGSYEATSAAQDAVDYATAAGVIIVAAAGNDDTVNPWYPAGLNGVIAVGAMSYDNTRASFSNYGSHLFVSAPG
ncbi:MAG: S8 family serine peptidase, partial [Cyclobacteriaceae bacterium]